VKVLRELASTALLKIEIHEGKKRQVRRMCAAVGHPVLELKRVGLAFLTLQGLQPGQYRQLTPDEVRSLKKMAASGSRNRVPQRGSRNRAPRPTARFPE
jgi:23S rRNA pseudouridine2605 synthase